MVFRVFSRPENAVCGPTCLHEVLGDLFVPVLQGVIQGGEPVFCELHQVGEGVVLDEQFSGVTVPGLRRPMQRRKSLFENNMGDGCL